MKSNASMIRTIAVIAAIAILAGAIWLVVTRSNQNKLGHVETADERPVTVSFTSHDQLSTWNSSAATKITFSDNGISSNKHNMKINGNTIKIDYGGIYELTGQMSDGQIIVDTKDESEVRIILNGLDLTSTTSAPIYIKQANKTVITIAEGTKNHLADGKDYLLDGSNDDPAPLFSKDNLVINGNGFLSIEGNTAHGIVSKDGLIITSGTYHINAVSDGMRGRDSIAIKDGTFTIVAGNDAIKSNNDKNDKVGYIYVENGQFNITAGHDGMQAESNLVLVDGLYQIVTNGGYVNAPKRQLIGLTESDSYKGLKSAGAIWIENGTYSIDTSDDAIHADGDITILNGNYTLSTSDDAIHSESNLNIFNGQFNVVTSYEGLEAVHLTIYDGQFTINATDDGINTGSGTAEEMPDGSGDMMESSDGSSLTIYNGNIVVNAGGDGLDSNGDIFIYGGYIVAATDSLIDVDGGIDTSGELTIYGGTIVGAGPFEAVPTSQSTQASIYYSTSNQAAAGSTIEVYDGTQLIFSVTLEKAFTNVLFSSDKLNVDSTYILKVNDTTSELTAH